MTGRSGQVPQRWSNLKPRCVEYQHWQLYRSGFLCVAKRSIANSFKMAHLTGEMLRLLNYDYCKLRECMSYACEDTNLFLSLMQQVRQSAMCAGSSLTLSISYVSSWVFRYVHGSVSSGREARAQDAKTVGVAFLPKGKCKSESWMCTNKVTSVTHEYTCTPKTCLPKCGDGDGDGSDGSASLAVS